MSETENPSPPAPPSEDLVKKISKTLSDRRKQRNLSVEDIGQALKMRVPLVKALEKGDWEEIPGGVYLRSFLIKYADFLGLNGDELISPYFEKPLPDPDEPEEPEEMDTQKSDKNLRLMWGGVGLVVVLFLGFMKFLFSDKPAPPESDLLDVPAVVENDSGIEGLAPVASDAETWVNHDLLVFSPYPLWLRVQAQDKSFEGFIPEGSTWTWTGAGEFVVRLGHTREVFMKFDGEPVTIEENQKRVYLPNET